MQKKHLIIVALSAIVATTGGYLLWPTEAPGGETKVDPSAKAVVLFDKLTNSSQWLDNSSSSNVINGIKVPPVPDPKLNVATVQGVDSDHNGIRDDLDRALAEKFGGDMREYQSAYAALKIQEDILNFPSKEKAKIYGDAIHCFTAGMSKKMALLEHLATNTSPRNAANGKTFVGWGGSGSTKDCPNEAEIRNSYLNSK